MKSVEETRGKLNPCRFCGHIPETMGAWIDPACGCCDGDCEAYFEKEAVECLCRVFTNITLDEWNKEVTKDEKLIEKAATYIILIVGDFIAGEISSLELRQAVTHYLRKS